jgi:heme-degrading monooxygenase HmoA
VTVLAYLRFVLRQEADAEAFERDLVAVRELAARQAGFRWSELGRDPWDGRRYVVVSEWDEVDQVRAFEHLPEHEEVMARWEPHYAEPLVHRRFVPWVRPPAPS